MHVFTYGSLMFEPVWRRVVAGNYASVPARLDDHARYAIREQSYPGVVAQAGAQVEGRLYLDVAPADIAALDRFEGEEYLRVPVRVRLAQGDEREAQTYLYRLAARLTGHPWEPARFDVDAFIGRHCG